MTETTFCEVIVSIAVSDAGFQDCCIASSCYLQQQRDYKTWLDDKRNSKSLWSIKTVKVNVPMPLQYEDMTNQNTA